MASTSKKLLMNSKEGVKDKLRERKKASKKKHQEKRARLIVKNLPFKANEENLKEYFAQYGELVNIDLLKKPDGKLVGCGFIQFKLVQKAVKARHYTNGKEFMGRQIIVDFVKSKEAYKKELKTEIKEVQLSIEPDVHKGDDAEDDIKQLSSDESNSEDHIKDESTDEENRLENRNQFGEFSSEKKSRVFSHDVIEGKTVFVKNVPFNATNDDLKNCMSQFGRIFYALICVDKLTEHSKGTGFVKFVNKEDADTALKAGTELTLMGNVLDCHPALERNEIQKKAEEKKIKEPKDNRNLYLVKEGVILAGTKAAEGVSAGDMAKRLQIEQYKTQMLRNLNMFVSRERLVVHNLPVSWDDKKLHTLLQKYGGPGAVVKEAKIMRDLRNMDANGVGKSKEYGFVAFTKHEHALMALRNLNNNPNIFSSKRRPIITFSIENKKMINAKLKRLEKSKINSSNVHLKPNGKEKINFKISRKGKLNKVKPNEKESANQMQNFSGITAKPGTIQKMRSRYKLTTQAKLHHENLKKEKRKRNNMKKPLNERKQDFVKQPKQKIKKTREKDDFSKLVNKYKNIVQTAIPEKKKWYEQN